MVVATMTQTINQPRVRSVARTCGNTPSQGSSQRSRRAVGIPRTGCVPRVQVPGLPLRSTCPEGRARRQCCRLRLPIAIDSARCSPETWAARDAARASSGRGSGELGAQLGLRLGLRGIGQGWQGPAGRLARVGRTRDRVGRGLELAQGWNEARAQLEEGRGFES